MTPATGFSGGADRDRTGGLLVANQALSQLSYSPNRKFQSFTFQSFNAFETLKLCHLETLIMVGLDRLELSTSPLSGVRSSHLSYRPMFGGLRHAHFVSCFVLSLCSRLSSARSAIHLTNLCRLQVSGFRQTRYLRLLAFSLQP